MRLAISNIAWPTAFDQSVAVRLPALGVSGVEIAPTKIWPHPLDASDYELDSYRGFWESRGLPIVAMQSLLFEKPDLRIFEDPAQLAAASAYLKGIIRLGGRLGARALVFGSPKNRRIAPRTELEVRPLAIALLRELGDAAVASGTCFCIEPNPPQYGCDFITTAAAGVDLVRAVDHPGVGLHLDAACMSLAGDPGSSIADGAPWLRHFHISAPSLEPVHASSLDYGSYLAELGACGYDRWISIEMKPPAGEFTLDHVEQACARIRTPVPV